MFLERGNCWAAGRWGLSQALAVAVVGVVAGRVVVAGIVEAVVG